MNYKNIPLTLFLFFLTATTLSAQDTIYFDQEWEKTIAENAAYYQIEKKIADAKIEINRKIFWINGQIKSDRNLREKKGKLVREGIQSQWYENGQLWYTEVYNNGLLHGEFIAFWEDGSKRRHDNYKKGNFKSGKVWNEQGEEIDHFPILEKPSFPGGQKGIDAYLKQKIPIPAAQKKGTQVRLVLSITINKEGYVEKVEIIEGGSHWYNAVSVNALINMPRWKPVKFLGEPINFRYRIPVTFKNSAQDKTLLVQKTYTTY